MGRVTTFPPLRFEKQAKFTDDGASILVLFSPDGSASSGLVDADDAESGSGPGPCDALLNATSIPPLGQGALCANVAAKRADGVDFEKIKCLAL